MAENTQSTLSSELGSSNLEKLEQLRRVGIDPYPYSYPLTHSPEEVRREFSTLAAEGRVVRVASRVMSLRSSGKKLRFIDLAPTAEDLRRNWKVQVMVRQDGIDPTSWQVVENLSLGDWLGVEGTCFLTRTGEESISAQSVSMLCKVLRSPPIPKVFDGLEGAVQEAYTLQDSDTLWRYPELDMLTRRKAEVLVARSRLLHAVRQTLRDEYGCIELETPFLNPYFGGAEATPFSTFLRAFSQNVFLAISPEIELKRAVVGGLGAGGRLGKGVFFIARNFRNEGVDRTHNPEFTAVEVYIPFVDYDFMMEVTERLYTRACEAIHGNPACHFRDQRLDFGKPWPKLPMTRLVREASGIDVEREPVETIREEIVRRGLHLPGSLKTRDAWLARLHEAELAQQYVDLEGRSLEELEALALRHKLHQRLEPEQEWDFLVLELFDRYCEPFLANPCHVILHPAKSTVLCKESRGGALPNGYKLIERFESFAAGMELSNAYSELNDPQMQRRLVEEQAAERAAGKQEAMPHNEQFLRAIEMGLPPCGGLGIGIDRMAMLLTDSSSIREVIAFPMLAQENREVES